MINVPNFDAMPPTELMNFWFDHQRGRNSKDIFPDGGKGSRTITARLAGYASNKATAMRCRENGQIVAALVYERICDDIYNRLPKEVKW